MVPPNLPDNSTSATGPTLNVGQCATLACLFEAIAPKLGNVHRGADFEDLSFTDFAVSAVAIGPIMEGAVDHGVGLTVLGAIRATRRLVSTNTNLGMVLLLAPLAAVPMEAPLRDGVHRVLAELTADDARLVYEAIRLAEPGGLGTQDQMDVADLPPADLLAAMRLAQERDLVARQFVNGFREVFSLVVPWLVEGHVAGWPLSLTIVHTHLRLLAEFPDSLIARKCGLALAAQTQLRAARALASGQPGEDNYEQALSDLDFWLRSDGHRRNPGTTADLVAAGLFVALRNRLLPPPWR